MEDQGFNWNPAFRLMMKFDEDPDVNPTTVRWGEADKPMIHTCFYTLIPHYYEGPIFEGATFIHGADFVSTLFLEHQTKVEEFKEKLPKKIDNIARVAGNRELIVIHDDCYSAFTTKALDWSMTVPFKPVHANEYYLRVLKANKSKIKKLNLKVAYQLPCASNYTPWQNEWIDEIMELIGCERVKREYDRDNKICCGAMVAQAQGKDAAMEVKRKNMEDAKAFGADVVALQCPLCALNLREVVDQFGMKPYMMGQLCNLALGWDYSGPGAGLGDDREFIKIPSKIITGEITDVKAPH